MSRTILEVSQLLKWPGLLTGIPRTMNELAGRFEADGAVFVKWDPSVGDFLEVDLSAELIRRQERNAVGPDARVETRPLLVRAAKRLERNSKVGRALIGKARGQVYRSRQQRLQQAHRDNSFSFLEGDRLFIIWGEAHDHAFIAGLQKAHAKGVKLIQFAHDMIPVVAPQFAGHTTEAMEHYAGTIYPLCELIYANSKHTKTDVHDWLTARGSGSVPPIKVVRLGDDFDFAEAIKPKEATFEMSGLKGNDFMLCVGTIEARKNHALLYYVYKLANQRGITLPKMVIVGRRGWKTDDIYEIMTEDPEVAGQFVFLHQADDENLSWLYDHCLFSVYVSFYEGWGLPIAESIMRGVPCIASNTSSMPEVADGLASHYVSPYSADECLAAITRLLDDKRLAAERRKLQAYKPITWDDTYQQIKSTIEQV